MTNLRLHRHPLSGHCHRVEMFLTLLDLPHELVDVDLARAEQKSPAFVAKNPFGQIPVLDDGDVTLADSNAILVYLARRYAADSAWLPRDAVGEAAVQRWFSVAAGPLAGGPATARAAAIFGRSVDFEALRATANQLFERMDALLATRAFLVGAAPTLADLAMYAYTAHAPEGGVSLAPYAHVRGWLARIEALPRFIPMRATKTSQLVA
jgi:glutathione S-transferase